MSDVTDRLQDLARTVETVLPPGTGFIVLAFDFAKVSGEGKCEYVSNVQRQSAIVAVEEWLAYIKAKGRWGS